MPRLPIACALALALIAMPAASAADPEPDVQLQRALDHPVTLTLDKKPLSEAFKQIAAAAKIPLQVDPASYELLPYGDTTQVSVEFKQSRLRDALQGVLMPLGLQDTVVGSAVLIRPSSPLLHIGRKADWEELKLMKELWGPPDSRELEMPASGQFNLINAIRAAMDGRKDLIVSLPVETTGNGPLAAAHQKAIEEISKQLPMTAYRALELYCQLTGQIWFVEAGPLYGGATGGTIRIMPPRQWIERQLDRPITLSHPKDSLEAVVADLSQTSRISFVPEPGLYRAVPVVSLSAENFTVRKTLDTLAGATQIAYDVRDDSILLHLAPGPGVQSANTTIGHITVPIGADGMQMDMYIRESDLPPELNELRKKRIQQVVEGMQKALTATPPAPATAPATQHAGG